MIIIGLIGEIAAGKTIAAAYLKQRHGAAVFRFSDALRDVARRLGLKETRANLQRLSQALRQTFGEDLLAKAMAAAVAGASAPVIIIEGIRRPSDIAYLKNLPDFKLVYVRADERTRFERLKARGENPGDAAKTWEQFRAEGAAEAEREIKTVARQAAAAVDNNGSLESLYQQLDKIV